MAQLDRYYAYCKWIRKLLLKHDWDYWTIISSDPLTDTGKSTRAIIKAQFVWDGFKKRWKDFLCYDPDKFLEAVDRAPRGGSVVLDEAGEAWYNREFQTYTNRCLAKASMQIRERNLNIILCVPKLFFLDSAAIANHKCWEFLTAPKMVRGTAELLIPKWRKYGREVVPYWRTAMWDYFPALPQHIYDEYKKVKSREAKERLGKYIEKLSKDDRKEDPAAVARKIIKKVKRSKDVSKYRNERGSFDWHLVHYHERCSVDVARTVVAVVKKEIERA